MLHIADCRVEDGNLPRISGLLVSHLTEEGRKAVVVVHRPPVEGMVVALGALDPHSQKCLRDILGQELRRRFGLVIARRRVLEGAAAGRNDFLDDLVDRRSRTDTVAQPMVIEPNPLGAHAVIRADLQDFRPFHDPDVAEIVSFQELVDQPGALFGPGVGQKLLPLLFGCRQKADEVDGNRRAK